MFTKEDVKKHYLKGKSQRYSDKAEDPNSLIFKFIEETIDLPLSHKEKVYCYVNDVVPTCKVCGKLTKLNNFKQGFKEYCSVSCQVKGEKEKQRESMFENNNKKVEHLSPKEIAEKLYTGELKIQAWRKLDKLQEYKYFYSIEQLYLHLVKGENQICKYCRKPFDFDKKTKKPRKCVCSTQEERIFFDALEEFKETKNKEKFIETIIKNKIHYSKTSNKIEKFYYKHFPHYPWAKSLNEDIYCYLNDIKEKPKTEFIDLRIGYKKLENEIKIDYSKEPKDVIKQFKEKYSEMGIYFAHEVIEYLKDFPGDSPKEKVFYIENGGPKFCQVCGKQTKFNKRYCSVACVNKGEVEARKQRLLDKFKKNELPLLLNNLNLELLDEYKGVTELHKLKCTKCGNKFNGRLIGSLSICRICTPKLSGISYKEKELLLFIKSFYHGEVLNNVRNVINGELDIYIPELKIAIEFNGLFWHSVQFREPDYHLKKTEECEQKGIQLIHIFEDDWLLKNDIVKSMIKYKLGKIDEKIYARNCEVRKISAKEASGFLENNHLQGDCKSPIRFGLFYKDELVSVMTFKKSHRSKEKYMELKRFANKLNVVVIGGFTKLLKYAKNYINEDIIAFADRSHSARPNVYDKNGFEYISKTPPNYWYIINELRESREKFMKHKLKDMLKFFDESLTEKENMHINGFFEIYDSGNYKYILKNYK